LLTFHCVIDVLHILAFPTRLDIPWEQELHFHLYCTSHGPRHRQGLRCLHRLQCGVRTMGSEVRLPVFAFLVHCCLTEDLGKIACPSLASVSTSVKWGWTWPIELLWQ
jgi:hypothetical protein